MDALRTELGRVLAYDAGSGAFFWRESVGTAQAGELAGRINDKGYIAITYKGREYRAHRIAWLFGHGRWPSETLDHINCNRSDNRLCNLREATKKQNNLNRGGRKRASGFKGVTPDGIKFRAAIYLDGKKHHLGQFDTAEGAYAAYVEAAKLMHGEFARVS